LRSIILVGRERRAGERPGGEVSYYLRGRAGSAAVFAEISRSHRGTENSLHGALDPTSREGAGRRRRGHGPEGFALLRRPAILVAQERAIATALAQRQTPAGRVGRRPLRRVLLGFTEV
jgi:hypothetical protein